MEVVGLTSFFGDSVMLFFGSKKIVSLVVLLAELWLLLVIGGSKEENGVVMILWWCVVGRSGLYGVGFFGGTSPKFGRLLEKGKSEVKELLVILPKSG